MEVKDIDITEIKPYERNAKAHPKEQVDQIAKSIQKFGWAQPLAIDEDGTIIIGHGRYEAAKKLKLEKVPCVQINDLTDEEVRMLRLADNKLNESEWLDDILAEELKDLDFGDLDLDFGLDDTREEMDDDKYTNITDIPQYNPDTSHETDVKELVNATKTEELLDDIGGADISEEEKDFLRMAAARHLRFDYRKIADYYAGASREMQDLMERSALVLIDYNDAIKNGYSTLREKIGDCV